MARTYDVPHFFAPLAGLYRQKSRLCVDFDEDALASLRKEAGLPEGENVLLLIDDSLLARRTKNVVFTDRRILWQEARGAPYKEAPLESLEGSSVFAASCGFASVITVMSGRTRLSFRFKNIRSSELLRVVFHDYLSRYCAGYRPSDGENETRYKHEVLRPFKRRDAVCAVFALAGTVAMLSTVFLDDILSFYGEDALIAFAILFWAANIFLPMSKSKMPKANILLLFVTYVFILNYFVMNSVMIRKIICAVVAVIFLKLDRVETDGSIKLTAFAFAAYSIFFALMMLIAIRFA